MKKERSVDAGYRRTLLIFLSYNSLMYMAYAVYSPYLTAQFATWGLNSAQIGILAAMGPVCAILVQPQWAALADRRGNWTGVLQILCVGAGVTLLPYLLFHQFLPVLLITFLHYSFMVSIVPLGDTVCVNGIVGTPIRFSTIRMGGTLGYILCVLITAPWIQKNPSLSFILGPLLLWGLCLLVSRMPKVKGAPPAARNMKAALAQLKGKKTLWIILALTAMTQVAMSFYNAFLGVQIVGLGYGSKQIAYATMLSAASEIPVLLLVDRALTRFKVTSIILFSGVMVGLRIFLLYLASGMELIYVAQLLQGVTYMTVYYSCVTYLNREMRPELKATGQSMLALAQVGLGGLLGNIAGGLIAAAVGVKNTLLFYLVFLILGLVVSAVLLALQSRRPNAEEC